MFGLSLPGKSSPACQHFYIGDGDGKKVACAQQREVLWSSYEFTQLTQPVIYF